MYEIPKSRSAIVTIGREIMRSVQSASKILSTLWAGFCHFFANVRSSGSARWSLGGHLTIAIIPTKMKSGK
jgi:hypothetical protein